MTLLENICSSKTRIGKAIDRSGGFVTFYGILAMWVITRITSPAYVMYVVYTAIAAHIIGFLMGLTRWHSNRGFVWLVINGISGFIITILLRWAMSLPHYVRAS
jgi:hypothetical protein